MMWLTGSVLPVLGILYIIFVSQFFINNSSRLEFRGWIRFFYQRLTASKSRTRAFHHCSTKIDYLSIIDNIFFQTIYKETAYIVQLVFAYISTFTYLLMACDPRIILLQRWHWNIPTNGMHSSPNSPYWHQARFKAADNFSCTAKSTMPS